MYKYTMQMVLPLVFLLSSLLLLLLLLFTYLKFRKKHQAGYQQAFEALRLDELT